MNIKDKKYYEVWLYKKDENGSIDYNYKINELIKSDKELRTKEDIANFFKKENKEHGDNIINSIISWSEMCYQEFVECVHVVLCRPY